MLIYLSKSATTSHIKGIWAQGDLAGSLSLVFAVALVKSNLHRVLADRKSGRSGLDVDKKACIEAAIRGNVVT